jgi:hypothetical protein
MNFVGQSKDKLKLTKQNIAGIKEPDYNEDQDQLEENRRRKLEK